MLATPAAVALPRPRLIAVAPPRRAAQELPGGPGGDTCWQRGAPNSARWDSCRAASSDDGTDECQWYGDQPSLRGGTCASSAGDPWAQTNLQDCEMSFGVWTDLTGTMGQCGCASDERHGEPNLNPAAMNGVCHNEQMVNVWFPSGPGTMAQCASGDVTDATILAASAQCTAPNPDEYGCNNCGGVNMAECSLRCGLHYMHSCAGAADFSSPTRTYYSGVRRARLPPPARRSTQRARQRMAGGLLLLLLHSVWPTAC